MKTSKFAFEINWPLVLYLVTFSTLFKFITGREAVKDIWNVLTWYINGSLGASNQEIEQYKRIAFAIETVCQPIIGIAGLIANLVALPILCK